MRNYVSCLHHASSPSSSVAIFQFTRRAMTSASVNQENFAVFKNITDSEWANEKSGAMKPLHALNRLRVPWITSYYRKSAVDDFTKTLSGVRLIDVGCGPGLLSNALCRLGADVVGLDVNAEKIALAEKVASRTLPDDDQRSRLQFKCAPIEEFAPKNAEAFDGVIASEVLEHVSDMDAFIRHCAMLAKPKSKLFFTTINKTLLSRLMAVWMAEDLLSIVPRGVHDWENFVEPARLRSALFQNGCRMGPPLGMVYNPLTNVWSWTSLTQVNYAVAATRS